MYEPVVIRTVRRFIVIYSVAAMVGLFASLAMVVYVPRSPLVLIPAGLTLLFLGGVSSSARDVAGMERANEDMQGGVTDVRRAAVSYRRS
jgi:hypothetical protein